MNDKAFDFGNKVRKLDAMMRRTIEMQKYANVKGYEYFSRWKLHPVDRLKFLRKFSLGEDQGSRELNAHAKNLRIQFDDEFQLATATGLDEKSYVENYLPGRWLRDEKAQLFWSQYAKKLSGTKTFTKEKLFKVWADALDASLKPMDTNPYTMLLGEVAEVRKAAFGKAIFTELKDRGSLVKVFGQEVNGQWRGAMP